MIKIHTTCCSSSRGFCKQYPITTYDCIDMVGAVRLALKANYTGATLKEVYPTRGSRDEVNKSTFVICSTEEATIICGLDPAQVEFAAKCCYAGMAGGDGDFVC